MISRRYENLYSLYGSESEKTTKNNNRTVNEMQRQYNGNVNVTTIRYSQVILTAYENLYINLVRRRLSATLGEVTLILALFHKRHIRTINDFHK